MTRAPGPPPPDLARVIEQARPGAPGPTDALRESVHARVTATVGGAGGAGGAAGSSGAGSGAVTGTLVKGGLAVLLAVGGGWALVQSVDEATPAPPPQLAAEPAADDALDARDVHVAVEPRRAASPTPPPAAAVPRPEPEDSLAVEEALLELARREIAADPASALLQLDAHARRFPRGQLAEERDLLRIRAHVAAGDAAAASADARSFLDAYPRSIHRNEVESLRSDP